MVTKINRPCKRDQKCWRKGQVAVLNKTVRGATVIRQDLSKYSMETQKLRNHMSERAF